MSDLFDEERGRDSLRWIREAEVAEAKEVQPPRQPSQAGLFGDPAFSEMVAHYEEMDLGGPRLAPSTKDSRRSYLSQALAWMQREGITHPATSDWQRYRNWRQSDGCPAKIASSTWDTHRKAISLVYEFCRRVPKRGWGPTPNPVHHTQLPPDNEQRREPRCMAQPEVTYERILREMPDPRWKAFVSLLFWLGPRVQEAIGIPLPGSEVDGGRNLLDLDRGILSIRWQRDTELKDLKKLKSGYAERVLELPPEPLALIREALVFKRHMDANPTTAWKRRAGFVESNYLFPFWRESLEKVMEIHRKISPKDFPEWERGEQGAAGYHVYRHTMATRFGRTAQDLGEPNWQEELHRILGHADMRTTDAYLKALRLIVVGSKGMNRIWQAQSEKQKQAVAERSGKGLLLVKSGETRR